MLLDAKVTDIIYTFSHLRHIYHRVLTMIFVRHSTIPLHLHFTFPSICNLYFSTQQHYNIVLCHHNYPFGRQVKAEQSIISHTQTYRLLHSLGSCQSQKCLCQTDIANSSTHVKANTSIELIV